MEKFYHLPTFGLIFRSSERFLGCSDKKIMNCISACCMVQSCDSKPFSRIKHSNSCSILLCQKYWTVNSLELSQILTPHRDLKHYLSPGTKKSIREISVISGWAKKVCTLLLVTLYNKLDRYTSKRCWQHILTLPLVFQVFLPLPGGGKILCIQERFSGKLLLLLLYVHHHHDILQRTSSSLRQNFE